MGFYYAFIHHDISAWMTIKKLLKQSTVVLGIDISVVLGIASSALVTPAWYWW